MKKPILRRKVDLGQRIVQIESWQAYQARSLAAVCQKLANQTGTPEVPMLEIAF